MLLKNKSSNKSQLALMAGLTLGTITTPTLVNAVHASPSIVQAIKQSPFNITNFVTTVEIDFENIKRSHNLTDIFQI